MKMKPVIIIAIVVVIVGIFGLLVTEIIDLRPNDSKSVRVYEDLKQIQNEWIAENCSDVQCNDGKSITAKIDEFIDENKNYFSENGFNMYGFDENGMDRYGRTTEQTQSVSDAYKACASNANEAQGCAYYGSNGMCMDSNKSLAFLRCDQQSKSMNENFKSMNLENLQNNP